MKLQNKIKYSVLASLLIGIIFLFSACGPTQRSSSSVQADDQKCWVTEDPSCDDEADDFLYMVGQTATPSAAKGRPNRTCMDSALLNANAKYVSYLENTVSTKVSEAMTSAGDSEEGSTAVSGLKSLTKSFAQKTVNGLKQADSYYVSDDVNKKGVPLWTCYVRVKVEKALVMAKFGDLVAYVQKGAESGNENAKNMLKGIQNVQEDMKKDDFFGGF
jgi:hypothetical protein